LDAGLGIVIRSGEVDHHLRSEFRLVERRAKRARHKGTLPNARHSTLPDRQDVGLQLRRAVRDSHLGVESPDAEILRRSRPPLFRSDDVSYTVPLQHTAASQHTTPAPHGGKSYPFSEFCSDPRYPQVRTIHTKIRGVTKANDNDGAESPAHHPPMLPFR
jgi:hypothetical protein